MYICKFSNSRPNPPFCIFCSGPLWGFVIAFMLFNINGSQILTFSISTVISVWFLLKTKYCCAEIHLNPLMFQEATSIFGLQ